MPKLHCGRNPILSLPSEFLELQLTRRGRIYRISIPLPEASYLWYYSNSSCTCSCQEAELVAVVRISIPFLSTTRGTIVVTGLASPAWQEGCVVNKIELALDYRIRWDYIGRGKNMGGFIKAIASRSCSSNRESKYLEKSYRHSITVRVHSSLAGEITTRVRS